MGAQTEQQVVTETVVAHVLGRFLSGVNRVIECGSSASGHAAMLLGVSVPRMTCLARQGPMRHWRVGRRNDVDLEAGMPNRAKRYCGGL